ncbi:GNAT family N-acetyltransferase [Actinoplanes sp. RD1]|uniref:GNAT family N-acetyltransferase n=1 Tax=Actinoplanes sp. RD1 TaxID=3064538 RepID=UPI002740B8F6|nr:GNAT family N-acetyltransferase [Actinoplanes sp. RD1]
MSFAIKPTLSGPRVVLRPFGPGDHPAIVRALRDPEVVRLTGSPVAELDEHRLRDWYGTRHEQDDRLDLAVVDRATGRWVGEVVLNELDRPNQACNFRILIGPDGRADATVMAVLAPDWAAGGSKCACDACAV